MLSRGRIFQLTRFLCSRSPPRVPCRTVGAFVAPGADRASTALNAERREFLSAAAAAAGLALTPLAANAIRDYENVGLLGGSEVVDVNNANVRVYLKMPGLYPTVAGKIASNGPYNSVSDIYNIPGLTGEEKNMIKKYESRFTAKAPQADYVIDRINNGLYVPCRFRCYIRFELRNSSLTCALAFSLLTGTAKCFGLRVMSAMELCHS
jgi:photosystem II PsbU protein